MLAAYGIAFTLNMQSLDSYQNYVPNACIANFRNYIEKHFIMYPIYHMLGCFLLREHKVVVNILQNNLIIGIKYHANTFLAEN